MFKATGVFIVAFIVFPLGLLAQKTSAVADPVSYYNRGNELFDKEKYGSAIHEFEDYLKYGKETLLKINAQYYSAASSLFLEHQEGEDKMQAFINTYPDHIKTHLAHYHLGRHYYNAGNYAKAITQLKNTNDEALTNEEALDYHFMLGYSYFKRSKWEDARQEFAIVQNDKTKYYYPSHYYLGYIALQEKKYDEALSHFDKVKTSKVYAPEIPIYIAQIYFGQKKYAAVLELTDTIKNTHNREIGWLRGQSLYYLDRYKEALPLLEENQPPRNKWDAADKYMMGYTYYANAQYEKAFNEFININNTKDTITQYAYYNAAESFLHLDRKTNARDAFLQASLLDYNKKIKERSMFNYAKLSFDLGFNSEALTTLSKFIKEFPKSDLTTEARTLQGQVLLANKNYKEAIEVLENITKMDEQTQRIYQQITYYRALELLDQDWNNANEAQKYLVKSKKYPWDKKLDALADFWQGEISYRLGKYWDAIKQTRAFMDYSSASQTSVYEASYYNLGYCYLKIAGGEEGYNLKMEHYGKAAENFRRYTKEVKYLEQNKVRYIDGMTRLADCNFVLKKYEDAIESYNFIITKSAPNSDYAYYQKGIIFGLQEKDELKISTLKKIPASYPSSLYVDDALYEIALVHLKMKNYGEAQRGFSYLLQEYPNGPYAIKSHLKLGVIYYQQNKLDNAIAEFKTIIERYPAYPETEEATQALEEIYKDKGEIDEFFDYMKDKGRSKFTNSYRDSATFETAMTRYNDENCPDAVKELGKYMSSFPNGIFIVQANFYKADCEYKLKNLDEALKGYLFVLDKNRPEFTEPATSQAATIYYLKKDYDAALPLYEELEGIAQSKDNMLRSLLGQTRCSYYLDDTAKTIAASKKLLAYDKVTREGIIEAHIYLARIYTATGDWAQAETSCKEVIKLTNNQFAAEAKYYTAYIQHQRNRNDDAEKTILDIIKNYSSYDYWKAKALLLQSDILIMKKDYFQARAILKSIISGYADKEDGIVDEAEDKLETIGEE